MTAKIDGPRRVYVAYDGANTSVCVSSMARFGVEPSKTINRDRRFEIPLDPHAKGGLALYCDGDFVFLRDPTALFEIATSDPTKAVWCVKHPRFDSLPSSKKRGEPNWNYPRKNWSSLMVFDLSHSIYDRFDPAAWSALDLHRFEWCPDFLIGELPREWNTLVGLQDYDSPAGLHFTHGAPGEKFSTSVPKYDREYLALRQDEE